ncbi:histidine kinase osmosensor, partial [Lunasporangiospora selenospora]
MALVRNELVSVRDQEQEASKKEAELKEFTTNPMDKSVGDFSGLSSNSLSPYSMSLPRATSSSNSIQSTASSSTANTAQGLEQPSEQQESSPITAPIATMRPPFMNVSLSTPSPTLPSISSSSSSTKSTLSSCTDSLSLEDQVFILESVLSLGHIPNLQEMLRAISVALDSILVVHPPEEMAIILWQKDERSTDGGGSWAIIEDKFQPGDNGQSTLIWTDLAERRDQMPVLVKKALDSREPVFSTAVGSRSQLPTIACLPIIATNPTVITGSATVTATNPASLGINQEDNSSSTSLSSSSGTNPTTTATATTTSTATTTTTLVGAIYLHHLHPRFYFSKRDRDMLMLFCQKLANPLLNCDRISILERNVTLATQRSRFLEDTFTRIQKTEHEVLSWMEALPCYVWAAERDDGKSLEIFSNYLGFTLGDLAITNQIPGPDDVAAFQKEVSQSYKTGVYKDCEFRLMRKDGVYRWHLSRAVPVLNQYGAVIKWIGVTIDIDDLYSAQKAELHKKSNFLANMSHELRTPFSGFHGMLSLLGYSNLDEEQQECVHTAKASCEKLLLIIDDLLDFSKLEADKVTLEASSFDLEEVFDEVEDIVEPLAKQKSLEMAFIKAENVPEVLIGDCNRLKQILLNLVGNAIKFTHSGHVIVKCKVLDRDFDMANLSSEGSMAGEWEDDDDKFYFRHEKNGGGQCRSENRPPNSGRFSSPEPLSETSIKLMFSVEDTGILAILSGRWKGRGSTFWFVVQCEQSSALPEGSIRDISDTDVPEPTKEIKRITRTMGKPRILIASNSETTVKALQTFRTDFNTEIADLPSIAASRLDESVANGLRFDFICWDFPSLDPNHEIMLELNARPDLLNVHFVLLYSNTNTDMIRRAQSLQLPSSSSSSGSSASPSHSVGAKRRPMASQPISLRKENTFNGSSRLHGSNSTGRRSPMFCDPPVSIPPTIGSVVPGLSPEMLSSLRITYISKPIRRLKLLRAFVEILDDSARIHGAQAVKKGSVGSSTSTASSGPSNTVTSTPTVLSPTSPTTSSVSGTSASLTAMASPISSPTTVSASSSSSALHSKNSSTTTVSSPVSLPPMSASMLTTLENALGLESQGFKNSSYDQTLGSNDYNYKHDVLQRPLEDYELGVASGVYKKNSGDDSMADKIETEVFSRDLGSATVTPRQQRPPVDSIDPTEVSGYHDKEAERDNLDQVGYHGQQQVNGGTDTIILTVQDPSPTSVDSSATGTEDRTTSPQTPEQHPQSSLHVKQQLKKAKSQELKVPETRPTPLKSLSRSTTPSPASLGGSNGGLGGLSMNIKSRSNSPKPTKTSKLVTEERSETSLSLEEAERISGMRILLAE